MPKVTVVIPALNEEETLEEILVKTKRFVNEIVVVDDGSVDLTNKIARSTNAVILSHKKKRGYDEALNNGFKLAAERHADIIVTLDADGQYNPDEISLLIKPLIDDEADIVVGDRSHHRRISECLFGIIGRLFLGIDDVASGFKAYRIQVYESIGYFDKISSIGTELVFNARTRGFRIMQRNITITKRKGDSRMGGALISNLKISAALCRILIKLVKSVWKK